MFSGSHWPGTCYLHWLDGRPDLALNQTVAEDQLDEAAAVDLELGAGQMSIDKACMIHGARANRSNRRRAGLALRYVPATSLYDRSIKMQGGAAAIRQDMPSGRSIWCAVGTVPATTPRLVRTGRSRSAVPSEGVRRMEGIGR